MGRQKCGGRGAGWIELVSFMRRDIRIVNENENDGREEKILGVMRGRNWEMGGR